MKIADSLILNAQAVGKLDWIGIRPAYRAAVSVVSKVEVLLHRGLHGDHFSNSPGGDRQVTLIQSEHLFAIASMLGKSSVDPSVVRRNLVVSGINLSALKKRKFQIGDVVLEGNGPCDPCSRMEEVLGKGGYLAMIGHGGITAKIHVAGQIQIGDPVTILSD